MEKYTFKLKNIYAFHFGNLLVHIYNANGSKSSEFPTVKDKSKCTTAINEIREVIKPYTDFEDGLKKDIADFVKPYAEIAKEFEAKQKEDGVTDEQKAEYIAEIDKLNAEVNEKVLEKFKERMDESMKMANEVVDISLYFDKLHTIKTVFDKHGNDDFKVEGKEEPEHYSDELLLAIDESLEAAVKTA